MRTTTTLQLLQVPPLVDDSHEFIIAILSDFRQSFHKSLEGNTYATGIYSYIIGAAGQCIIELVSRTFRFEG